MIKGYKIRLYPTPEQEQAMWAHVHAARWIWNWALGMRIAVYHNSKRTVSSYGLSNMLPCLKEHEGYEWINEVSAAMLQRVLGDLEQAYRDFFKKKRGFPKFKSRKKTDPKFPVCMSQGDFYFKGDRVQIAKLGKIPYHTNYDIPQGREQKFSNPRISYDRGKWLLSFGIECESQVRQLTDKKMGIDLGIKDLAVVSYGEEKLVFHNINKSKRMRYLEHKRKHLQRSLSRKYKVNGSYEQTANVKKVKAILQRVNSKLTNKRKNYVHQTTHALIELLPYRITVEDLNVSGMMKNKHLSKAIQQQCFAEFIRQIEYKCEYNGIEFQRADTWYPSSKTCSGCGSIKKDLKLKDRVYVCPVCGLEIDRDFNAAINLERYADHAIGLVA
jgi:putative transposase